MPLFLLLCCFCDETQIWLGDLRVVLVCGGFVCFCFDLPFLYGPIELMYFFSHRLCLIQDRALVRYRPIPREKKKIVLQRAGLDHQICSLQYNPVHGFGRLRCTELKPTALGNQAGRRATVMWRRGPRATTGPESHSGQSGG